MLPLAKLRGNGPIVRRLLVSQIDVLLRPATASGFRPNTRSQAASAASRSMTSIGAKNPAKTPIEIAIGIA